jgi:hypothetical protein
LWIHAFGTRGRLGEGFSTNAATRSPQQTRV